ncbi:MAG: tyrosine-type recombinase/integrase, partial [Clostridia bacterium]|nr:tyrosine-type recombinase/integrase [Clostridia bacterium]
VSKNALDKLDGRDVIKTFPAVFTSNNTALILKKPKTKTSVRRVWLPKTVAEMLVAWKKSQSELKEFLGDEYHDFNMVIALPNGRPLEGQVISRSFKALIREHDLPDVVFHSLRHTSTTYKLKLNRGDMKAVQGDTGHAQLKMVSDVYSHILDEDRRKNATQFEEAFYHADRNAPIGPVAPGTTTETEKVMELLNRTPELAAQLLQLLNIANSKTAVMVGGN